MDLRVVGWLRPQVGFGRKLASAAGGLATAVGLATAACLATAAGLASAAG